MDYTLLPSGAIRRADGALIPADPRNADYAAYLRWVSAGNAAADAQEPSPSWYVPVPVLFARLAEAGKGAAAQAMLLSSDDVLVRLLSLREGVANDDPEARQMIAALGADPAAILARP